MRFFLLQSYLLPFRNKKNRNLTVFNAKLFCCFQGVFRENARAIEIIKAVISVKPSADDSVMRHGVIDYISKFLARVATLCGLIRNHNAFGWHSHSAKVYREAIWMCHTVSPDLIGNTFDLITISQSATIET